MAKVFNTVNAVGEVSLNFTFASENLSYSGHFSQLIGPESWLALKLHLAAMQSGHELEWQGIWNTPTGIYQVRCLFQALEQGAIALTLLAAEPQTCEPLPQYPLTQFDQALLDWLNKQPPIVRFHASLQDSILKIDAPSRGSSRRLISRAMTQRLATAFTVLPLSEVRITHEGKAIKKLIPSANKGQTSMSYSGSTVCSTFQHTLELMPNEYKEWGQAHQIYLEELQYSATVTVQEVIHPYRIVAILPWRGECDRLNQRPELVVGKPEGMELLDERIRSNRLKILQGVSMHGTYEGHYTYEWEDESYPVKPDWPWEFAVRGRRIPGTALALISTLDGPNPMIAARQQDWWLTRRQIKASK